MNTISLLIILIIILTLGAASVFGLITMWSAATPFFKRLRLGKENH